jgi:hypothetical protein
MTIETITLTPDSRTVALRQIGKVHDALSTLAAVLAGAGEADQLRPVDAELPTNVLKVAEFELSDLGKTLGIETDSAAERDQRYVALRQANMRVRDLQAQLGNSQGADITQASIKALAARVDSWWKLEGFGHISDIAFGKHGCTVNFSCSLFGDFPLIDSATPVSDKERKALWHASLRDRGFVLAQDDRDWVIEDCDASRKALVDLFAHRLPSAHVLKLDNFHRSKVGRFVLRGVEVHISTLADILTLPEKPAR